MSRSLLAEVDAVQTGTFLQHWTESVNFSVRHLCARSEHARHSVFFVHAEPPGSGVH